MPLPGVWWLLLQSAAAPVGFPGSEWVVGMAEMANVLRDTGLVGVAVLLFFCLITRRLVLGWTYDEVVKARDREKARADALELLVARLTMSQRQTNEVTTGLLLSQVGSPSSAPESGAVSASPSRSG